MPRGTFIFIFEDEDKQLSKEFIVDEDADLDTVIEAFTVFLELCGLSYDEGNNN